ncbi:hypothetical protein IT412_02870 [Candidatus Peregrinibacteria bacterium]|nr:hypothetical protein [Candidatus Peregrinibacteria bacterium]
MKRHLIGAIADIDDTLIPWEKPHSIAYPAMSLALSQASGLSLDLIIENIREVNSQHGTIEYTALIQEMPCFTNLSAEERSKLIKIAINSRREAMKGLNNPFEDIEVLLETILTKNLVNIALSDAPKNLAYLRLKKAGLLNYFNRIIGTPSPDDRHFEPEFHMDDKDFLVPTSSSIAKKPDSDLEALLNLSAEKIRQQYFLYGNSAHSDMGLAKRYGLLFYHTKWDLGTLQERAILKQYAPESALKHNVGTAEDKNQIIHPDFELVTVTKPSEIIDDLQKRGLL